MNWQMTFNTFPVVPFYILWPNANLTLPNIPLSQPETQRNVQKKERVVVNLTDEQLLEGGYEVKKTAWTEKEDKLLLKLCNKNDLNWKQVAEGMPNRTAKMCYSRWRRLNYKSKNQWTDSQDQMVRGLVSLYGYNWSRVSQFLEGRTAKQVEEHYLNYLRPQINKEPWTFQEDKILIQLLGIYGKSWGEIEKVMIGRTQTQIKNRYFGRLKRMEDKKKGFEGKQKGINLL